MASAKSCALRAGAVAATTLLVARSVVLATEPAGRPKSADKEKDLIAMDDMTEAEALAEGRIVVEIRDSEGGLVERSFGASTAELLAQHRAGECATTCSWCHQALADKIGEDAAAGGTDLISGERDA